MVVDEKNLHFPNKVEANDSHESLERGDSTNVVTHRRNQIGAGAQIRRCFAGSRDLSRKATDISTAHGNARRSPFTVYSVAKPIGITMPLCVSYICVDRGSVYILMSMV